MNIKTLASRMPLWLGLLSVTVVLAADTFIPNEQPYGYQAPVALSKNDVKDGTAVAFVPWFESSGFSGELLAAPVSADGVVDYFAPLWRASEVLPTQDWHFDRRIVTVNDDTGLAVPFRFTAISEDQQKVIGSEPILNYVRGDRSGEGAGGLRERKRILGDIIHSNPVYVGKPLRGYLFNNYLQYAAANRDRPGRVYVGSNDGMLHAFNADTGNEEFAYIPSILIPKLPQQAQEPFTHNYMVDGPLVVEDAYFGGAWHSVLVGGLGAGGMGLFALDVTSPAVATEIDAASRILWEFTDNDTSLLGHTYSRPSIVRINDGRWAVIVGNGYMSKDGKAALLVIDISNGSLIQKIEVDDNNDNGLSSPTVIDVNGDFTADFAYAGDLNGNLWKFDLRDPDPSNWAPAWDKLPLFMTEEDAGTKLRQPITTAPTVGVHPEGGYFVYVATGQLLSAQDALDAYAVAPQAVYGIWDNIVDDSVLPLESYHLLQQTLGIKFHPADAESVRTATSKAPDWQVHRGWATRLDATGQVPGTRVVADHVLRNGRIQFTTVDPATGSGNNYLMQLSAYTGGAPGKTVIDVNMDGSVDVADNVDGDGNGAVENTAADRVVGQYLGFGTASQPVVAFIGDNDAAIVNKMYSVLAYEDPYVEPAGGGEEDAGLVGGHIDVDTAHEIYDFDDGTTDEHVHEWDDKYNATVIDFFDIHGDGFADIDEPGMEPSVSDGVFIINVANAHLSPGGVIEINGAALPVREYRAKTKRYLTGNLGPSETFPRYKLTDPTPAEALAGIVKLTDFKMSFAKDGLLLGGVHPTNTGCVRGNEPGQNGEYRNGALTIQALDAFDTFGGHVFNPANSAYETGSHAIHQLGYPVSRPPPNDGSLFWETTIFWHWGGKCFGPDDAADYNAQFAEEVTDVDRGTDDDISGDPPPPPDPGGDGDGDGDGSGEPPTDDVLGPPNASVSTTEIAGESAGRLSWRELMIDE